jgi:hypothetical protein
VISRLPLLNELPIVIQVLVHFKGLYITILSFLLKEKNLSHIIPVVNLDVLKGNVTSSTAIIEKFRDCSSKVRRMSISLLFPEVACCRTATVASFIFGRFTDSGYRSNEGRRPQPPPPSPPADRPAPPSRSR